MDAAISFIKSKIINSELDQTSIMFYGCQESHNSLGVNNIYIMQPLDTPNAESIKRLEVYLDKDKFNSEFHPMEAGLAQFNEVLNVCQNQFSLIDDNNFNKRIFVFTNNEYPITDEKELNQVKSISNDLIKDDIGLELFPMSTPDQKSASFNIQKFFAEVITMDESELKEIGDLDAAYTRVQELKKHIKMKEFKKKAQGNCKL